MQMERSPWTSATSRAESAKSDRVARVGLSHVATSITSDRVTRGVRARSRSLQGAARRFRSGRDRARSPRASPRSPTRARSRLELRGEGVGGGAVAPRCRELPRSPIPPAKAHDRGGRARELCGLVQPLRNPRAEPRHLTRCQPDRDELVEQCVRCLHLAVEIARKPIVRRCRFDVQQIGRAR